MTLAERIRERMSRPDWKPLAFQVKWNAGGRCQICGKRFPWPYLGLEAHHNNLDNLGHERPGDLIALCSQHHAFVTWDRKYGCTARATTADLLGLVDTCRVTVADVEQRVGKYLAEHHRRL